MHCIFWVFLLSEVFTQASSIYLSERGGDVVDTDYENENIEHFLSIQDGYRNSGGAYDRSRQMAIAQPGDDDHVWSSAPTESTNAPTPSGTTGISATCMNECPTFDATTWNLDNWCEFYWDAGCYLPAVNFLNLPAGTKEVSDYNCIPDCLKSTSCGASYCKTFSHLSSSCRTGYAHLLFNSTLQDKTHELCVDSFLRDMYAERGWDFDNGLNLTYYVWQAAFTIVPVDYDVFVSDERNIGSVRSALAHLLSGVSLRDVTVVAIENLNLHSPTLQPTFVTPQPSAYPTLYPTASPSSLPTTLPTSDKSTFCSEPQMNQWCNNNQGANIYLGVAFSSFECQSLCNAYVGVNFVNGCCQWYAGNLEAIYEYHDCVLQPEGFETFWPDDETYYSALCNSVSAYPTFIPTLAPSVEPGLSAEPTPIPTHFPTRVPTIAPSPSPSVQPTEFFSAFPTRSPTIAAIGIRITLQINTSTETLGLPIRSSSEAYSQLRSELQDSFANKGFIDSINLAGTSYNATTVMSILGVSDLSTALPGYDVIAFPTAAPTLNIRTPAPTPTTFFEAQNSTSVETTDNTAAIVGGSAAAVVGLGAAGTAAYQYGGNSLLKVAAEPAEGIEMLMV